MQVQCSKTPLEFGSQCLGENLLLKLLLILFICLLVKKFENYLMLHTDNGGQENHFPEHKDVKLLWVCGYDTTFASYPEIDNLPAVPFSYPYDKLTHAVLESN